MENLITKKEINKFQSIIYEYYRTHGRKLPWRETRNPYHILVSEIMLQQTQVHRVVEKYGLFIHTYPDFFSLDNAPVAEILTLWQGLGYNRRALGLKKIANTVCTSYNGILPQQKSELLALPWIGKATAASVLAFAFNKPEIVIETNIRAVFIRFFFSSKQKVTDAELYPYIELSLDRLNPRTWYYALMDYGVYLKKKFHHLTTQSAHYKKQPPFKGSDRQIRGMVLKILTDRHRVTERELLKELKKDTSRVKKIVTTLINEGFIEVQKNYYTLKH